MIDYKNVKLAVCIPTRDQMHSRTTFCLYNLADRLRAVGIDHRLFLSPGTLIADQRAELVKASKEWGATHLMFIDSDIMFDPQHALNLLDFNEMVVAAAYSKRVEPLISTAWFRIDDWNTHVRLHNQTQSHVNIEAVALGFCMINMEVFEKMKEPWFSICFREGAYTGEDIEFCRNCLYENIPIWLDVKTSLEIGHLGTKEYRNDVGIQVALAT